MKTALLVIPATNGKINRKKYISDCINDVIKQGYMPFCYDIFSDYAKVSYSLFLSTTLPFCDVVFAYADFGDEVNTMDLIRELAPDKDVLTMTLVGDESEYTYVLENILEEVADKTRIPVTDLKSRSRARDVADARFIYYRRSREITKDPLSRIGRLVDRDHATVLYGIKQALSTREVATLYERCYGK
jgi:hypothetical protein